MKKVLFLFLLLCSFWNYGIGQIQYTGCNGAIAAGYPITLNLAGNDGTRNFYVNTLPGTPCSAGTCAFRVIWTGSQWEVQLSTDGGATYPNILYANTAASLPDPPDLSLGTWVALGPCVGQLISTWTGNVQSTTSSCSDPTIPSITSTLTSICAGSSTTLTISGTLNDATNWHIYTGSCGGTQIGMTSTSSFVVSPLANTTYFVRGEDGAGCVNEVTGACGSVAVTVNTTPNAPTISAGGPTTFCAGGSVTLTSNTSTGNQWFLNGSGIGSATGQTFSATTGGNYTVASTVNGCTSGVSSATAVTVNTTPNTPTISAGGPTIFCAGGSVTLTSGASTGNQWFLNGNAIGSATGQTFSATTGGNYTVASTVNGCTSGASSATAVTVNTTPNTPTISAGGPTTFCAGGSVTLTSGASTGNQWFLNGNGIAGGNNQTFSATTGGNYTVTSTVNGCTSGASSATAVTVNATPSTPTISAGGPTTFCAGGSVTLTSNTSTGNQWFLNGNAIGSATGQTFVATTGGNYTVTSTVNGCTSGASSATAVTVNLIPNSMISTLSTTIICNGSPVTLTSVLSTGNQWFLNGNAIAGATNQTFSATTGGNYTVESTINGCTSGPSSMVTIGEITMPPTVISASSTTFCTGGSVTLTSTTAPVIQWFVNGIPLVGATSQTLVVIGAGVYSVEASNSSCTSNSNLLTIVENPIPSTPIINTPSTTTICNGIPVTLASTISTGNQWFLNGNAIAGATNQTIAAATGGNYTVTSTVNGCTSSASGIVTIAEITIQPTISTSSTLICIGDSTILTSSIASGIQWFFNGNLMVGATNQTLDVTAGGIYMVEATNGGCSAFSNPLTIVVNPTPVTPAIIAGGSTAFCTGESVTFNTMASTGNQWFLNGSAIGGATNQTLVATTAGNYSVEFTMNGCSSTSSIIAVAVNNPVATSQTFVECAGSSITVGSNTYTASGTYLDTLIAANGCDSIMTTDLTILSPVDTTITATLPTLTANASTAAYQWVNCDSSYMPLAGATTQAYTPTANGNYAVIITEGNCSDTSNCYAVIITGIKNNKLTKMLTLFPNPTSGNLSIELGQVFSTVTISVTSVTGQHLSTKTFKSTDKIDFNIEGVAGVYLLEITTNEGDTTTIKVLKK
jgi:hypothetical protein